MAAATQSRVQDLPLELRWPGSITDEFQAQPDDEVKGFLLWLAGESQREAAQVTAAKRAVDEASESPEVAGLAGELRTHVEYLRDAITSLQKMQEKQAEERVDLADKLERISGVMQQQVLLNTVNDREIRAEIARQGEKITRLENDIARDVGEIRQAMRAKIDQTVVANAFAFVRGLVVLLVGNGVLIVVAKLAHWIP